MIIQPVDISNKVKMYVLAVSPTIPHSEAKRDFSVGEKISPHTKPRPLNCETGEMHDKSYNFCFQISPIMMYSRDFEVHFPRFSV
jgi:hypothetical protein